MTLLAFVAGALVGAPLLCLVGVCLGRAQAIRRRDSHVAPE